MTDWKVPDVCLLDPDGDVVRYLRQTGRGALSASWACFHTEMYLAEIDEQPIGVVGNAVGAPFAVLVAEQLFASGCALLVSVTSAGAVAPDLPVPSTILIERALRGEGTSSAYLPACGSVEADQDLIGAVATVLDASGAGVRLGTTWTTDAPYRETETAIALAVRAGAHAVEMEAAALYAFAAAQARDVVCFAHVTNKMAVELDDFEKGESNGAELVLALAGASTRAWRGRMR